jgi:dTMP kinase
VHRLSLPCRRALLVSTEGINGVGKTYLTARLAATLTQPDGTEPLVLEEFSARTGAADFGRALLAAMTHAAPGDMFLRSGTPAAETLLLLAIKMHDLDTARPALATGRLVFEGRSLDTTAVYQALIMHPRDGSAALNTARTILHLAASWRMQPDLTILVLDDPDTAITRAQTRGSFLYSREDHRLQHQAARLYEALAPEDPARIHILDRRTLDEEAAVQQMRTWITAAQNPGPGCPTEPWKRAGAACTGTCRLAPHTHRAAPTVS